MTRAVLGVTGTAANSALTVRSICCMRSNFSRTASNSASTESHGRSLSPGAVICSSRIASRYDGLQYCWILSNTSGCVSLTSWQAPCSLKMLLSSSSSTVCSMKRPLGKKMSHCRVVAIWRRWRSTVAI